MKAGNSRTQNYLAGLVTGYTVTFAGILVGLWLTPFVLRHLDREAYGIFALGSDVIGWLALLDIGISAGLNVHLARRVGTANVEEINRYVSSTFFAQLIVVLLVLAVGLIIAFGFPTFFKVPADLKRDSILLVTFLVFGSAVTLGVRTFSTILVAHQQIHIDNLIRLGLLVIRTALTIFLLRNGWGLVSLAAASLTAVLITSALSVFRSYRLVPGLSIQRSHVSWDVLKEVGGVGIWFSLGGLAGLVILNLDRAVAGKMVSLEAVTLLVLTGRLYSLVQELLNQISNTARPALGQLLGQGKKTEALTAYRQMFTLSNGLAITIGLAIFAGNREFVIAWVGIENYGGTALDAALLLNLLVNVWILPNRAVLSSGLIVKPQTISRILEGILNLMFSVLLTLKFGLIGVALSTSLAALFTSFWYLPRLTARMFEHPFLQFWREETSRMATLFVAMFLLALVGREIAIEIQGFKGAFVASGTVGLCGFLILWFAIFEQELRARILNIIPNRFVALLSLHL